MIETYTEEEYQLEEIPEEEIKNYDRVACRCGEEFSLITNEVCPSCGEKIE